MELLLLSSSRTPAGYLTDYLADIKAFSAGIRRALFVPYAAVSLPWEEYGAKVGEALRLTIELLQSPDDLEKAELIIVGGANTFQLLRECRTRGMLEAIRRSVIEGKAKYPGWSAGANLACPTLKTTNDMPIVDPGGLEALGLVPFQINPHYLSVPLPGHHGETRDERLAEFARLSGGAFCRRKAAAPARTGNFAAVFQRHGVDFRFQRLRQMTLGKRRRAGYASRKMKPQGRASMDGASVFRLISLIPERAARAQSGCLFNGDGSAKMDLLCRFLHWMGPLNALTKEEQQFLGVRAGGGRSLAEGDETSDEADDLEETPMPLQEAGTQIAA